MRPASSLPACPPARLPAQPTHTPARLGRANTRRIPNTLYGRNMPTTTHPPCSLSRVRKVRRCMLNSKALGSPPGPASAASCSRTHASAGSRLRRWICAGVGVPERGAGSGCEGWGGRSGRHSSHSHQSPAPWHTAACSRMFQQGQEGQASGTRAGRPAGRQHAICVSLLIVVGQEGQHSGLAGATRRREQPGHAGAQREGAAGAIQGGQPSESVARRERGQLQCHLPAALPPA